MKGKILVIMICTLLISLALLTIIAEGEIQTTYEDDVEISITAGFRGKDFGLGVCVETLNHKTENVTATFYITFDYFLINDRDFSYEWDETIPPESSYTIHISCSPCRPGGIKFVSITVEVEGKIVTRNGFSINNLLILFK